MHLQSRNLTSQHASTTCAPRAAATCLTPLQCRQATVTVLASGGGGFGSSSKKRGGGSKSGTAARTNKPPPPPPTGRTSAPAAPAGTSSSLKYTATPDQLSKDNWIEVLPDVDAFFAAAGKLVGCSPDGLLVVNGGAQDIKAITLAAGKTLVLYRESGVVYCTDVNSTAYQFPMVDADVLPGQGLGGGPAVEVPLDGTLYDLASGKVLKWCPKSDNAIKNVFASLKRTSTPVDLPVFPTHVTPAGKLRVRLVKD